MADKPGSFDPQLPWFEEEGIEQLPKQKPAEPTGRRDFINLRSPLYLEDVERLYVLLVKTGSNVQMKTDRFRFRLPSQLVKLPQETIRELDMECAKPYVRVDFTGRSCSITAANRDEESMVLFESIREIVASRENSIWRIRAKFGVIFFAFLSPMFLISLSLGDRATPSIRHIAGIAGIILIPIVAWLWLLEVSTGSKAAVIPYRKRDVPKAWYLSDAMKITLVTNVITAVIAAAFGYFLGQNK